MKRCSMCQEMKALEDFMWRRKRLNERDCYCRPCRAIYKREHYRANKPRYIQNAQVWSHADRRRRVSWLIDYFKSHPCVDCGETDPVVLEFDHLRDKAFNIADGISRNRPWALILEEIEKCEVVCANCHRKRTSLRGGFARLRV